MTRAIFILAMLATAPVLAQTAAQLEANKQVVHEFYKYFPADPEKAASLFTDDHVEHAPRFVKYCGEHNLKGKACFVGTMKSGVLFGGPGRAGAARGGAPGAALGAAQPAGRAGGAGATRTPELVTAEKDLVTFVFKRSVPDPETPGRMYDLYTFDTYRIRDGRIAEHWDGATINPPAPAPPPAR